jgi:hypothetical protein
LDCEIEPQRERVSAMKRDYDFSRSVREQFFRKGAELNVPIYVDEARQQPRYGEDVLTQC